MKICQLTTFPIIHVLRVVACFSMAGCAQSPAPAPAPVVVTVYQACDIDPEVWKQVQTPLRREALLELKGQADGPTRKYFVTSSNDIESWFENSSRDLLACRYMRQENCGGGMFSTVIFRRNGELWKAESTMSTICSD
jgi:hypothetical protein